MIAARRREAAQRALALDDRALLQECEEEFFTARGPGGQHRNKAATGVRLSHAGTELSVTATERRSQVQNRRVALERLRGALRLLSATPKVRRRTAPTEASRLRRLEQKAKVAAKKSLRRRGRWAE